MNFDEYSANYRDQVKGAISFVRADADTILQVKADHFVSLFRKFLKSEPLNKVSILDVGCGIGLMDKYWTGTFGKVTGVDVSTESVALARQNNPSAHYLHYEGTRLPFEDASFNACVTVCVMHHVPSKQWALFMGEMKRVTKPGGMIVVYELNPFNPLTRMVVNRCPFDADAELLSPWKVHSLALPHGLKKLESKSILFFPWKGDAFRKGDALFGWLPMGGQYVCAYRKPSYI